MSLRYEQYEAIRRSREFLRWVMAHRGPLRKKELRDMASRCLRHFPILHENGQPMWSQDPFTEDVVSESVKRRVEIQEGSKDD